MTGYLTQSRHVDIAMSALVYLVTCIEMDFTEHPSKVGKTHLSEHFRSNPPNEKSCETIEKKL